MKPIEAKSPTLWRRFLSYLEPQIIAIGHSAYSGYLELSISRNRYMLASNNAVYSYEDLYHNFAQAFEIMQMRQYNFDKILVLGMGLGSVAQMLIQKHGQIKAQYTLVEIDPIIIDWAKKYTLPKIKEGQINIVESDAYTYIQTLIAEKFDLIIIDIFVDDIIPENLQTIAFMHQIKSLLNKKGILLFNCLYAQASDKVRTTQFYEETFKQVFQQHQVLDVKSNWILMAKV